MLNPVVYFLATLCVPTSLCFYSFSLIILSGVFSPFLEYAHPVCVLQPLDNVRRFISAPADGITGTLMSSILHSSGHFQAWQVKISIPLFLFFKSFSFSFPTLVKTTTKLGPHHLPSQIHTNPFKQRSSLSYQNMYISICGHFTRFQSRTRQHTQSQLKENEF